MKRLMEIRISTKLGLLFSGIFVVLLLIMGSIFYGVFLNVFEDYIKQDLLVRGKNHAEVLEGRFNKETIMHVIRMEKGATTKVVITDPSQRVIDSSTSLDLDMKQHLLPKQKTVKDSLLIESDWKHHDYMISVSPIGKTEGYVYMYYPSKILREIVLVLSVFMLIASIGIVFLALGLIGILSRRLTQPLLMMKDATNKMSMGQYQQKILVTGNDEIAQLGKSIQTLGEQLAYYENSRNEFLASVSHELRTPLTYMKGYSDILNKGLVKNPEEQGNYLKIINKEAVRISALVNDLFEMSKFQAGKFEIDTELTNINPLIEKVVANFKPELTKKGLELEVNLTTLPKVMIDPKRMEQVFYNLIENAIKYSIQGRITISSYQTKDFVKVKITDTGIGIPQDDLPKIWDSFYRVDQSRTRMTGGTGLGLYVVKKIVEAHGGQIMVESSLNHGTTFLISLKRLILEK
ncbi:sensor histidine kinase [Neobacillus sp. LXY-1]|uniref:sensor histidine kinase n=1 Tax=Neobacillus sp. LXY-1 TaxID=3379133 RepID=UPI003EE269CC